MLVRHHYLFLMASLLLALPQPLRLHNRDLLNGRAQVRCSQVVPTFSSTVEDGSELPKGILLFRALQLVLSGAVHDLRELDLSEVVDLLLAV